MRKVLLLVFALLTTVISWAQSPIDSLTYHAEDGGYYEIASAGDLWHLFNYYNSMVPRPAYVFKMTQDIDMVNNDFEPIASYTSERYFNGTFDGNGHTISNL